MSAALSTARGTSARDRSVECGRSAEISRTSRGFRRSASIPRLTLATRRSKGLPPRPPSGTWTGGPAPVENDERLRPSRAEAMQRRGDGLNPWLEQRFREFRLFDSKEDAEANLKVSPAAASYVRTGKAGPSVGSHKPGGDGPGTKKFKHEHDDGKRRRNT